MTVTLQSCGTFQSQVVIAAMASSQSLFRTTRGTLIQTLAPDSLRGRLTSLQSIDRGFLVVASLGVGLLSDLTSPSTAMAIIGVIGLALVCCVVLGRAGSSMSDGTSASGGRQWRRG